MSIFRLLGPAVPFCKRMIYCIITRMAAAVTWNTTQVRIGS